MSDVSSTHAKLPLPAKRFVCLLHICSAIPSRGFQACRNGVHGVQGGTRLNLNKRSRPADSLDDGWQQWPGAGEAGGGDDDDDLQRAIAASMADGPGEISCRETFMSGQAGWSCRTPILLTQNLQLPKTLQVCGQSCDCISSCAGAAPVLAGASSVTGPAAAAAVRQQGLEAGSQAEAGVQGNGKAAANGRQQHGQAAAAAATVSAEPDAGPGDLAPLAVPLPEVIQAGGMACNIAKQREVVLPCSICFPVSAL